MNMERVILETRHHKGSADIASLSQAHGRITLQTEGAGFVNVTGDIARWLTGAGAGDGLLTVFMAHTSASLTIQENSDPNVQLDLKSALNRLAPEGPGYHHAQEGPDDMPAHIKSMLTSVSLSIPVLGGRMTLGTWQGVFAIEHRARPHERNLELHFIGTRQTSAS